MNDYQLDKYRSYRHICIRIEMPSEAKISIFTDNDLTHITGDHFEIKLVARLLDQIYVVPSPQSPPKYDDTLQDPTTFTYTVNSTGSPTASALMLPLHMLINPTEYVYMHIIIIYVFLHLYIILME